MPRVAISKIGTPGRSMWPSKITQASAPRSSAARKSTIECPPDSSSPSQVKRRFTGRAPPATPQATRPWRRSLEFPRLGYFAKFLAVGQSPQLLQALVLDLPDALASDVEGAS